MTITERQEQILNSLIQEYIQSAKPVSSDFLNEKYELNVCSATLRKEMQKLTEMGYLFQPHISAGRVPTNKGYRFFVNKLLGGFNGGESPNNLIFENLEDVKKRTGDIFQLTDHIAKILAEASSNLVLAYLLEKDFLLKEGWKEVFHNPEFRESGCLKDFAQTLENLEKDIKNFVSKEDFPKIKVYIGREKSFLKSKDFSLIISKGSFPNKEEGVLAILGPKRMEYRRNIKLINSLIKSLEEISI